MPAPPVSLAFNTRLLNAQNGLTVGVFNVKDEIEGCAVKVYTELTAGAAIQPLPLYATDTVYAPVTAPPDVVKDGDTRPEPVVVAIPGPVQVYTGVPAPMLPAVAVRVIEPPTQNGFVADDVNAVNVGCGVIL